MLHTVRRYVFVYYVFDGCKMVRKCYTTETNRFGKAFHSFCYFFNSLETADGYKDYSQSYYICNPLSDPSSFKFPAFSDTDLRPDYCRQIPSKYYGYLLRSVPEV